MKKGKKLGMKEGIEKGMDLGRKEGYQVAKEGFDKIIQAVKAKGTPKKTTTRETAIQTDNDEQQQSMAMQTTPTSSANAVMQTAPNDELPHLLNDVGTSMEHARTDETAAQTNDPAECRCTALQTEPPDHEDPASLKNAQMALCFDVSMQTTTKTTGAATQTENDPAHIVTSPPFPATTATSPGTTAAWTPSTTSTTLTTATTTVPPASEQPPKPQNQQQPMPGRPTAPLPSPQPPLLCPEPRRSAATSLTTLAATPAAATSKTASRAVSSSQTTPKASENITRASNEIRERPTAQKTEPCNYAQTCLSEHVVSSMERPCQPNEPQ